MKSEIIQNIVANCDCWKSKNSQDMLASMSEDQLRTINSNVGSDDDLDEALTDIAAAEHEIEAELQEDSEVIAEQVSNVAPAIPVAQPLTEQQWLAAAPPAVQSAVRNAMALEQQARQQLIDKLTANVTDPAHKAGLTTYLSGKDLAELQQMSFLQPAVNQQPAPPPALPWYQAAAGSGAPAINAKALEADADDILPVATLNYADIVAERQQKAS